MKIFFSFFLTLLFLSVYSFAKVVDENGYYRYAQVLAIRDFDRAKTVMDKLDAAGYDYVIRSSTKKGEIYYRVVVGPLGSIENSKKEQKSLEKFLRINSSFILKYKDKPKTTVDLQALLKGETPQKKVIKNPIPTKNIEETKKKTAIKIEKKIVNGNIIYLPVSTNKEEKKEDRKEEAKPAKPVVQKLEKVDKLEKVEKLKKIERVESVERVEKTEEIEQKPEAKKEELKVKEEIKLLEPANKSIENNPKTNKVQEKAPKEQVSKQKELSLIYKEKKPIIINDRTLKKRIDKIVNLSFSKESFQKNKEFVCNELDELVEINYAPAILLLASNYIKGDECVSQDLSTAIYSLERLQEEKELPSNFKKFSKELLSETYIKTQERDNLYKARKVLESLLLQSSEPQYLIYIYKRLAYVEYSLKEYSYMNLWLEEASKLGDIESQLSLGKNYFNGIGTKKDIEKAKAYFTKCLDKDQRCGEHLASIALDLNQKKAPSLEEAFIYYEKAKKLGSLKASEILDNKQSVKRFYTLMKEEDIQHSLIKEYMYKYLNDRDIKNLNVSNIVEISSVKENVFVIFSLDGVSKAAKLDFEKNRHNYWVVKKFKMADSIIELK